MEKIKEKLYVVCDSSIEIDPRQILRVYKNKSAAYAFLWKYVSELNKSTYTGYLSIAEIGYGEDDQLEILGAEDDGEA